jgi:hypothetical protein
MNFFVMRLPETGGIGAVPETAVEHHRNQGWVRVSDALSRDEYERFQPQAYVDAPDLDAEPEPKPASGKRPKKEEEQ